MKNNHIFAPDWFAYCRPATCDEKGNRRENPGQYPLLYVPFYVANIIPSHWNSSSGKAFANRDKSEDLPMTAMEPITSGEGVSVDEMFVS